MKSIYLMLVLLAVIMGLHGTAVTINEATSVAQSWYQQATGESISAAEMEVLPQYNNANTLVDWFTIRFGTHGFILISADDVAEPVLAYSTESNWDTSHPCHDVDLLLSEYHNQYNVLRSLNGVEIHPHWQAIRRGDYSSYLPTRAVNPLCSTTWNQDYPYNSLCPTDYMGPGGHAYAGCVATAMGQIMKFWNYPTHGYGNHSYTTTEYGTLNADFQNTSYNFAGMPNSIYSVNNNISTLLYHCGVSVNMQYAHDGSGAYGSDACNSFALYFGYEGNDFYALKQNYQEAGWIQLLKDELDNGRPILYGGQDTDQGGHAWVCDGYTDDNHFHMNWGWGGSYNGNFFVSNLNPMGYNFSTQQSAVCNIHPAAAPVPPTNLTASVVSQNVSLQWSPPAQGTVQSYNLYRNGTMITTITNSQALSYVDGPLSAGSYLYYLVAHFQVGDSAPSNTASAVIYPMPVFNYQNGFDNYPDFAALNDWYCADNDLANTETISGYTFPNQGQPMSFIAFNPAACTPPLTTITPVNGTKMAACFAPVNGTNNDWLITPRWFTATRAVFRFWARSAFADSALEQIEVGYSPANALPQDMQIISGAQPITVPTQWTRYEYVLDTHHNTNCFMGVHCISSDGSLLLIDRVEMWSTQVDNEDNVGTLPLNTYSNYPNPFNQNTTLSFYMDKATSHTTICIYNTRGQRVASLAAGKLETGRHSMIWNGLDDKGNRLPSGLYYYKLAGEHSLPAGKMLLLD